MARGRKKQEVEVGYVKERFIVDLILSEEELAEINEIGKTKYISDLVKKDFNTSDTTGDSYTLTVTDEIREKFNNDPRRAYLLGQLLTEFYCNIRTESRELVDSQAEYQVVTTAKVEKAIDLESEEIAVENDVEVKKDIIEAVQIEKEEIIKSDVENNSEIFAQEDEQEQVKEIVAEKEAPKNETVAPSNNDGRVGRLNTAPLMKKRLGKK